MKKQPPISHSLSVEIDGKTYPGDYSVSSGVVTVQSMYGCGSTQIGGSTASSIARVLLREIVEGAKARGEIH
jgi:hypothetical protein